MLAACLAVTLQVLLFFVRLQISTLNYTIGDGFRTVSEDYCLALVSVARFVHV